MGLGIKTASRQAFRSAFFGMGFHMVGQTQATRIRELMRKMRPLPCGVELIRVGSVNDGGYLIPNDLEGIEYCFSPGVNTLSDFENDLADRGIRSFLADWSVESAPINRPEFVFDKKFVGAFERENYFTFSTWKDKYLKDYTDDLILQMDIEGAEYEVILSMPDSLLNQFRIIAIEFHGLDRLFDSFTFNLIPACLEKLLKSFHVAHLHPNNAGETIRMGDLEIPESMEITFLNKRRVSHIRPQLVFPHPLDSDCSLRCRPLTLAKCWYASEG